MCNCENELAKLSVKGEERVYDVRMHAYGRSDITIRKYRKSDGAKCKHDSHTSVPWEYCPFCGEKLVK